MGEHKFHEFTEKPPRFAAIEYKVTPGEPDNREDVIAFAETFRFGHAIDGNNKLLIRCEHNGQWQQLLHGQVLIAWYSRTDIESQRCIEPHWHSFSWERNYDEAIVTEPNF